MKLFQEYNLPMNTWIRKVLAKYEKKKIVKKLQNKYLKKNILERLFQVEMPYFIHGLNILSEQYKSQNAKIYD